MPLAMNQIPAPTTKAVAIQPMVCNQAGDLNEPITAALPVNLTKGQQAKPSCKLNTTWLHIKSASRYRSPAKPITNKAGINAATRVITRITQAEGFTFKKPSMTI